MLPTIRMTVGGNASTALDSFGDALEDEMEAVFARGAQRVVDHAKQNHRFANRTGQLESTMRATGARGTFLRGTMVAEAVAPMPYASFVEQGTHRSRPYPYLQPALEAAQDFIEDDAIGAVERSIARARG
jgi:hypothetical protein